MPRLSNPEHAYIYVIGEKGGPYKIGYSGSPNQRLNALRQSTRMDLEIWLTGELPYKNARGVELLTHKILAEHRVEGEWFSVTVEQAEAAITEADRQYDARPKVLVPKPKGHPVTTHLDDEMAHRFYNWQKRQPGLMPMAACLRALLDIALTAEENRAKETPHERA